MSVTFNSISSGIQKFPSDSELSSMLPLYDSLSGKTAKYHKTIAASKTIKPEGLQATLHHRPVTPRPVSPRHQTGERRRSHDEEDATQSLIGRSSPVKLTSPARERRGSDSGGESSCCQKIMNCFSNCFSAAGQEPNVFLLFGPNGMPMYYQNEPKS